MTLIMTYFMTSISVGVSIKTDESENNECFDDVIELKWPDHTSAQTSLHKT